MTQRNIAKYYELSGQLQKLSTSIFIGYQIKQKKHFAIRQNGTKIAYKEINEENFQQKNTFLIKDIVVCEAEDDFTFTLETPRRTFLLKAINEQTKTTWMKAITRLRKQIIRKKFKLNHTKKPPIKANYILSSTQHTAPHSTSLILNMLNQTQGSIQSTSSPLLLTQRTIRTVSNLQSNPQKEQQIKRDLKNLLCNIPQDFIKYNTYVVNLKTRVQNLFTATFSTHCYILFSSKSLYPNQHILEDNLTNIMLPTWAQINRMYKILPNISNPKLLIEIPKIIEIQSALQQKTCIKIRTQENVHTFYCHTMQEKERLMRIVSTSIDNYKQVLINGKLSRKNYDKLIWAYHNDKEQLHKRTRDIIQRFIPNSHQYQPEVVIKFIDLLIPFIQEFSLILKNKKQSSTQILLYVLKQLHQQTKIHIKLTWDSSYSQMKGECILRFLNALSAYHLIIKDYISDYQFMTGMKQLSKIYVRESWKNFEDIILGIVEQQKKLNLFQDEDNDYIQTNSITDLFKFIYEVYDLASPCWDHKIHLNNVQKLMSRAISVYINELKASVDDNIIPNQQLIAIANNYFRFSITIDDFYNEKFSKLQQKTKETYDKLKKQQKQLSMIILDKLTFDIRSAIKTYFSKHSFFKIDVEKIYEILRNGAESLQIHNLHNIFIKRFYEKIFLTIRESILYTLQNEVSSKKKPSITKIIEQVDKLSFDLIDISNLLYKGKPKIDKDLNEINILLQCENQNEILALVKGTGEDIRNAYINIIQLREDYYVGGPLYYALHDDNLEKKSIADAKNLIIRPAILTVSMERSMRASFSSYYMNNDFDMRSVVSKSDDESVYEPLKLISEGYLMKCKANNKKVWEKEYLRLKNGTLYFYHSDKSEKCQNSISVSQILKVAIKDENLSFEIHYVSLAREKLLELKCQTIELRERWIDSLNLQIKRVKNDEKVGKHKLKLTEKKKNYLIIDYEQLFNGKGYFSYTSSIIS